MDVIVKVQLNTKLDELQREEARERSLQNLQQIKPKESTETQLVESRKETPQENRARRNRNTVQAKIGQTIGVSREQYRQGKKVLETDQ